MKIRVALLSGGVYVLLWSCKPNPIHTELAGYTVQFPITVAELQRFYPNGYKSFSTKFVDTSHSIRAEWWFNTHGTNGNRDLGNQPYSIGIFLKNEGSQFDSIKTALEKHYGKTLLLLNVTRLGKYEPYQPSPPVYACHLNKSTILALSKASSDRGDSWSQYNSVRTSIGYNLNATEEERFAVKDGRIHEDTD